ncbi:hypothetical protein [Labrys monachus]|uniref:Uncharacterized protein n=1 Tax=Labrys monachus TaxID=217067 RepID=A0ABU0F9V4_9HYPH|nr:hypothetical protein [Labrys monachus]MDQ0391112.1 hypothetical protein [Labrys monachus]
MPRNKLTISLSDDVRDALVRRDAPAERQGADIRERETYPHIAPVRCALPVGPEEAGEPAAKRHAIAAEG